MSKGEFDIVVRGGTIVTAFEVFKADVGIRHGRIEAIGRNLGRGDEEIDAKEHLVLPAE